MDYNQRYYQKLVFHHRRINRPLNICDLIFIFIILTNFKTEAQNFSLVTSSLRTFQTAACDGQLLHLNCKPNTVISILFAQYGIANNKICPHNSTLLSDVDTSKNCTESLRYSLLKKVESTCRESSSCTVDGSTKLLGVPDQCPNTVKYAEVAYRCRPDTFINKIACAEKSVDFTCPSRYRILIYSAIFGTTSTTPLECANNTISHNHLLKVHQTNFNRRPFKEYCQAIQATATVADRCHTQSNCSFQAQFEKFQMPPCVNELTNDDKQTQVHLRVSYACVQNEVLKPSLISSNTVSNSISNTFSSTTIERKNHRNQNKTKDAIISTLNEPNIEEASTPSVQRPPVADYSDNNLLLSSEFNSNSRNTLYDHQNENVHPTHNDNLPAAAVRSNELPTDFKTHISNPNQAKSIEPFKDWSSFCQYIENNLERLLIYLLVALCVALLFCFIFLGLSHLTEKKSKPKQCASLECSVQEDCCDSKPDLSNSISLNKANHVSSVFAGFEEDNPTVDEIIGELHRNGSFIGISQQLNNQLNAQLAQQQHCKTISNQMLLSANAVDSSTGQLLNCHQLNNQLNNQFNNQSNNRYSTSTFSPSHHNNYNNIEKYNYFQQNAMYQNDQNSPQKLTTSSVPQSASFYNMHTYAPIYTSPTNQTIGENYQQPTQTNFQQLQPTQLLISNQSDENGSSRSTTTTMTTIGSQTDSNSSNEMQIGGNSASSMNGILHPSNGMINNVNNMHSAMHNQMNSISPSTYNPVTLQILTTPQHLNGVQLAEATVFQPL